MTSVISALIYVQLVCGFILLAFVNLQQVNGVMYEGAGILRLMLAVPVAIAYGAALLYVSLSRPLSKPAFCFIIFYIIASVLNVNLGIDHFIETTMIMIPIIALSLLRLDVPHLLVLALYGSAIVIVINTYDPYTSLYGYLPGQTISNLHEGQWWRVSIWNFATPPLSAAFALVVLLSAFSSSSPVVRSVVGFSSLYWIVLSASKAGYLGLCVVTIGYFVWKFTKQSNGWLRYAFLPLSLLGSLLLQVVPTLITSMFAGSGALINSVVFRSESAGGTDNLNSRVSLASEHLDLLLSQPLGLIFGIERNRFLQTEFFYSATDSLASFMVVNYGVWFLALVMGFWMIATRAIKEDNLLSYLAVCLIFHFGMVYGGFFNFTNPIFSLLVMMACTKRRRDPRKLRSHKSQYLATELMTPQSLSNKG